MLKDKKKKAKDIMVTYDNYDVVFQEIPNEVSLAFTIEGCPNNCEGCHSPHLREQNGIELTKDHLKKIINQYDNLITCVLFLGGDSFHDELYDLINLCKENSLKTALYSGNNSINGKLVEILDYYKIGCYIKELGGLNSKTTNQKLYKIEDITNLFWSEKENYE